MKANAYIGLFLWLACHCSAASEPVKYETSPAVHIDYEGKRVRYSEAIASFDCAHQRASVLDTSIASFECAREGSWISLATPDLRFAYNLDWSRPPPNWDHGPDAFSFVGEKHSPQYGTYFRVLGFTPSHPGRYFITDYSAHHGIIGFYRFDEAEGSSERFTLISEHGLGANAATVDTHAAEMARIGP